MNKQKLNSNHFCYVLFLEMSPADFINILQTNQIIDNLVFLETKKNLDLYQEAKERLDARQTDNLNFDFDYDTEPFVFNKYIDGKLDRAYKICIFEYCEDKIEPVQTSNVYCEGMPLFFDGEGNMIKTILN